MAFPEPPKRTRPAHDPRTASRTLPTPALETCLATLPRDEDSAALALPSGPAEVSLTWLVSEVPRTPPDPLGSTAAQRVRLRLKAPGLDTTLLLAEHEPGELLAADLSACDPEAVPTRALCKPNPAHLRPRQAGVVSELAVVDTTGYAVRSSTRWTVLRTQTRLVIRRRNTGASERNDACDPTQDVLVGTLQGTATQVTETVLTSAPAAPAPAPIDCAAAWLRDGRCPG